MPRPVRGKLGAALALGGLLLGGAHHPLEAQRPGANSIRRDTLPTLEVRVTRAAEDRARLPMAVGVLGKDALRRAQLTAGLDEALSRLPGVVVQNRYNFSLDQRVSLRGAGSRANFGLRGVKVLLDGVPQTLPDGQSQLTNLALGVVDRAEVLTGSAGALYGNASGGVLAFTTESPAAPFAQRLRVTGGSFGTAKAELVTAARSGRADGLLAVSELGTDGFRQHGKAEVRQLVAKADYLLSDKSRLGVRLSLADAPLAQNPGALTFAEYAARRDSAAGSNILRGADKSVTQQQLALTWRWGDGRGAEVSTAAFGLLRNLDNPLATPPPPPVTAASGTYNQIDRRAGGVRLSGTVPVRGLGAPFRLTGGLDAQAMRDDRTNQRSSAGAPTGEILADQRETVSELGPFVQAHWEPVPRLALLAAARWDRLAFRVRDRHLADSVDNSGRRVMQRASGSLGFSLGIGDAATVYSNVATSFESPTTTELVNTSNGTAGFNAALDPQRTVSVEAGARGRIGGGFNYSAAVFSSRIRDAIIQAREVDGRAFFQNAGRVRNRGVEAGLGAAPWRWLRLDAAYTFADYRFTEYRIPNGAVTDTLDGKRLAGVPRHFFRATAAVTWRSAVVELDQTTAGVSYGDDRNTLEVDGWGAGVTTVRVSGSFSSGALRFEPFGAVLNLFDRRYVGSVNINGAFGRVLEPAPGRNALVGLELGWVKR
ncbi:MAG TPA: TonB-dependent receptor [Gemmatimonadales bacterium]|jgi:iron complex outermembrane receptor protein|nr:TonB-dependent receptor [Gemmatimonadales bacterium]